MNSHPQPYTKRSHLSISSLESYSRCPRMFFYSSGCRLQEPSSVPYFSYGSAFHLAIPLILSTGDLEQALSAFDTEWDGTLEDQKHNRERAKRSLEDLRRTCYPSKWFSILEPPAEINPPTIQDYSKWEVPWALHVGLPIPLVGRIDGLAKRTGHPELWALEYKTSSEVSNRLISCMSPCPQTIASALYLREVHHLDVAGTIVIIIRKSASKTETLCHPIMMLPHWYDDLLDWVLRKGSQLLAHEQEYLELKRDFPKDLTGCSTLPMFGVPGMSCPYTTLCHSTPDWRLQAPLFKIGEPREFLPSNSTPLTLGDSS